MRIVVNNLTAIRQKTGIGHYVSELVYTLRTEHQDHRIVTFPGPIVEAATRALSWMRKGLRSARSHSPGGAAKKSEGGRLRKLLTTRARGWADWHFRTFWSGRSFDLYHEPNYIPFPCEKPTVATIHDLSPLLHPEWHPAERVAHYERHFATGLRRCAHLLADSEFTRGELIEHFQVKPATVTCVPLGMRADLRPMEPEETRRGLERLGLAGQYLLHVGTMEPRKNLLTLLRAYVDLPSSVRERCPLVLVGGWGWNVADLAEYYHDHARHRGVRHLGYVPDGALPALYNGARALVFPTNYEGFGLPPLEMLACGGAVLASTAGAVRETVGAHAHLLSPSDLPGWRAAMARVIADDDWHADLCRGGPEVARRYSWRRCAGATLDIYRAVLGQTRALPRAA